MILEGKRILLGVTGSIAAIKAPIIARELMRRGATVICAMTDSAQQFTTPTALAALTKHDVITSIFPKEKAGSADVGTWHIDLGRSLDVMLIAPCSATMIGKLANGIYDDPVSLLAASLLPKTQLIIAPAMDEEMWNQPIVQDNLEYLQERLPLHVIAPVEGALASGLVGQGRMKEAGSIANEVEETVDGVRNERRLGGMHVLITGGPTYEPIDPVRFIGNRSSGKMAVALANSAYEMGSNVTLVMGPSAVKSRSEITRIDVETAQEMYNAVMSRVQEQNIVIMSAAVSDFSAEQIHETKLKKREMEEQDMSIKLRRTPDILSSIAAAKKEGQIVVGFALETGNGAEAYAKGKLEEKELDMIVLNRADESGAGFGHDTNKITLFTRENDSKEELPLMSKAECAEHIIQRISDIVVKRWQNEN